MRTSRRRQALFQRTRRIFILEFVEAILAAIVVAALLRIFVVSVYRVPTESMMPTLIPGDFIAVSKTSYGVQIPFLESRLGARDPERGDVVVFRSDEDDMLFVKRVVGVAGDRVEIKDGVLSVNEVSTLIPQSPVGDWELGQEKAGRSTHRVMKRRSSDQADFLAPQIVPPGHVFVLGDLRSESVDSRQWGPVSVDQIVGRAAFIGMSIRIAGLETLASHGDLIPPGKIRWGRTLRAIE